MATHGKLSSKIKQLKFMQRAAATDRDRTTHTNTTEEPSVSYRVQDGQGSSTFSEDWAVQASKTRCIVMTRTNPGIETEGRQGILSFGQIAGPIDVEEQQEALVAKDIGAAGQGEHGEKEHHDDASRAMKRKSPPLEDDSPHEMDRVADAMHAEAHSDVHSLNKKKKKKKKKREP